MTSAMDKWFANPKKHHYIFSIIAGILLLGGGMAIVFTVKVTGVRWGVSIPLFVMAALLIAFGVWLHHKHSMQMDELEDVRNRNGIARLIQ